MVMILCLLLLTLLQDYPSVLSEVPTGNDDPKCGNHGFNPDEFGDVQARVAERLIGIEEAGLGKVTRCEDIPDWARISDVEVKFNWQGRLAIVRYSRQRSPLEKIRETVVESVRW